VDSGRLEAHAVELDDVGVLQPGTHRNFGADGGYMKKQIDVLGTVAFHSHRSAFEVPLEHSREVTTGSSRKSIVRPPPPLL